MPIRENELLIKSQSKYAEKVYNILQQKLNRTVEIERRISEVTTKETGIVSEVDFNVVTLKLSESHQKFIPLLSVIKVDETAIDDSSS